MQTVQLPPKQELLTQYVIFQASIKTLCSAMKVFEDLFCSAVFYHQNRNSTTDRSVNDPMFVMRDLSITWQLSMRQHVSRLAQTCFYRGMVKTATSQNGDSQQCFGLYSVNEIRPVVTICFQRNCTFILTGQNFSRSTSRVLCVEKTWKYEIQRKPTYWKRRIVSFILQRRRRKSNNKT